MNEFVYLDVFLELPTEVLPRAEQLNQSLSSTGKNLISFGECSRNTGCESPKHPLLAPVEEGPLKRPSVVPHLTLFMGFFPVESMGDVSERLRDLAFITPAFDLVMSEIEVTSEGYVFWKALLSNELRRLHDQVVDCLNPLRRGAIREKFKIHWNSFNETEQRCLKEYGFPWVKDSFSPHITVGRFLDVGDIDSKHFSNGGEACGTALMIGLGKVGEFGVVENVIHKFLLKKI